MNREIVTSLNTLLRMVVRSFFTDMEIVVVDMIQKYICFRDDPAELETIFGIHVKYVKESLEQLVERGFLQKEQIEEAKLVEEGELKGNQKTWVYFCNYKYLYASVVYHIDAMEKSSVQEESVAHISEGETYLCPECGIGYSTLAAILHIDSATGEFLCHKCVRTVLVPIDVSVKKESKSKRTDKLISQLSIKVNGKSIRDLIDGVHYELIPEFHPDGILRSKDYLLYLRANPKIIGTSPRPFHPLPDMGRFLYTRKTIADYEREEQEAHSRFVHASVLRNELPEFLKASEGETADAPFPSTSSAPTPGSVSVPAPLAANPEPAPSPPYLFSAVGAFLRCRPVNDDEWEEV